MGEHINTTVLLVVVLAAAALAAILRLVVRKQTSRMTEQERQELERQVDEDVRMW